MKINFTKKEYRLLLDIVYLGQWMMQVHETDHSDEEDAHEMLAQKIYSVAKEMGYEDFVESAKELNKYYPTRIYEEESGLHEIISQYNDDCFWDELIDRLAERDTRAEAEALDKKISSAEEYWELSIPHESKYAEEFSENGLKNLIISET